MAAVTKFHQVAGLVNLVSGGELGGSASENGRRGFSRGLDGSQTGGTRDNEGSRRAKPDL